MLRLYGKYHPAITVKAFRTIWYYSNPLIEKSTVLQTHKICFNMYSKVLK